MGTACILGGMMFVASCGKEENNKGNGNNEPKTTELLPSEMEERRNFDDHYFITKFYYDEQNRFTKIEYNENGTRIEETFTYDEAGRIIRMESKDYSTDYTYSGNKVTTIRTEGAGEFKQEYKHILSLNEKGLVTERLVYYQSSEYDTHKYEYDENGNLIKYEDGYDKNCKPTFTYDDKKSMYSSVNMPIWWFTSGFISFKGNNLLSRKGCGELTLSYEYNEYDYPTKMTVKNESGLYIQTIKYINAK